MRSAKAVTVESSAARPTPRCVMIVGACSVLGRHVAAALALAGTPVVLVDEDLTMADAMVEWMRSVGASARVETLQLSRTLVSELGPDLAAVIDVRTRDVCSDDLAAAWAAALPPGSCYARVRDGASPSRFGSSMKLAEDRKVGVVVVEVDRAPEADAIDLIVHLMKRASKGGITSGLHVAIDGT